LIDFYLDQAYVVFGIEIFRRQAVRVVQRECRCECLAPKIAMFNSSFLGSSLYVYSRFGISCEGKFGVPFDEGLAFVVGMYCNMEGKVMVLFDDALIVVSVADKWL